MTARSGVLSSLPRSQDSRTNVPLLLGPAFVALAVPMALDV
jgi:hypothetical protein